VTPVEKDRKQNTADILSKSERIHELERNLFCYLAPKHGFWTPADPDRVRNCNMNGAGAVCTCAYCSHGKSHLGFLKLHKWKKDKDNRTMDNGVFWDIKPKFVVYRRHYFSATKPNQLMLCKIWGFHGSDYEEWRLLECYAVWLLLRTDVLEEPSASIIRVTRIGSPNGAYFDNQLTFR
jgi:hypothetical protein